MSTNDVLQKLKMNLNSRVRLSFRDGEILIADLDSVLEDENLIVFDLVKSNRPDKYERTDKRPHVSTNISDVMECEGEGHAEVQ
jgi:small nuclear ribonucleoprotein (snRNP)-like protein